MREYEKKIIENELILIESENDFLLGPNSKFINCKIINKNSARTLSLYDCEFIGGSFNTKKQLTNFQEDSCLYDGVKFFGKYVGCEFGGRPDMMMDFKKFGLVKNCNFSNANMHHCRLFNAEVETITFTKWPVVSVLYPKQDFDAMTASDKAEILKLLPYTIEDELEFTTVMMFNAEKLSKDRSLSLEEIKNITQLFPRVCF